MAICHTIPSSRASFARRSAFDPVIASFVCVYAHEVDYGDLPLDSIHWERRKAGRASLEALQMSSCNNIAVLPIRHRASIRLQ
jgi:hypothetical protein